MIRFWGTRDAEERRADTSQNTPRGPSRVRNSKIRRFLRRGVHIFNRIFSSYQNTRQSTSTECLDSNIWPEDMSVRPGSATSRQFLHMSEIFVEHGYMVGPKIGSGNYAKVRVVERRQDGKILAAKIIIRDKAPKDYVKNFMPRELEIIQNIKHDYIAEVYEVVQTDQMIFMVMDYAPRGDLLEYIKSNGPPSEPEAKKIFKQVVSAVQHLHERGIVHRDLKCENILLKKDGNTLLTDFGFSRKFDETGKGSKTFCGSAAYASPQLIEGIPYNPYLNDAWGLGCILFILACGSMPYDDSNIKKMVKKQKEGAYYPSKVRDKVNPDIKELINKILVHDETKRCTVKEMLKNSWLMSESKPVGDSANKPVEEVSEPEPMEIEAAEQTKTNAGS